MKNERKTREKKLGFVSVRLGVSSGMKVLMCVLLKVYACRRDLHSLCRSQQPGGRLREYRHDALVGFASHDTHLFLGALHLRLYLSRRWLGAVRDAPLLGQGRVSLGLGRSDGLGHLLLRCCGLLALGRGGSCSRENKMGYLVKSLGVPRRGVMIRRSRRSNPVHGGMDHKVIMCPR